MGKSASKSQQVSDTGEVNSNIYLNEGGMDIPWDIRVTFYAIAFVLLAQFLLLLRFVHRRTLKKQIRRSMAVIPLQDVRSERP